MTLLTLSELAEICGARLEGLEGDGSRTVSGPAGLSDAEPDEVSFLTEAKYADQLETTRAAAVIVGEGVETRRGDLAMLRVSNPRESFNRVVMAFAPVTHPPPPGVHPSSAVDSTALIAEGARIGPLGVIGAGAEIADGAILHGHVIVGEKASVGEGTEIHPGVVLYPHVRIGKCCILHAGTVIGSDGFGFEPTPEGWVKTPQGGIVIIEDDVEIGANAAIDCARFKATVIENNVKIDNQVHIAHNCRLGASSMFLAQSAVAGSTRVGKRVIVAGQAGLGGHLEIGDGARVGAGSAVFRHIPAGQDYWGTPAGPKTQTIRRIKSLERIDTLVAEVRDLRRRLAALEEEQS